MAETPDRRLTHRSFVSYIDKSRNFYASKGYERPYEWAKFDQVPFTRLAKPLTQARIGLVTTSSLPRGNAHTTSKVVYHHSVEGRPSSMFTDNLAWDKDATNTDDTETFLPLDRLGELAEEHRIGAVNHRFYGVPTEYSQRKTGLDAEVIAGWCADDEVDAVLLVPL